MSPLSTSFRRLCRRLHYWFGVALAIPFLVIAVTGCILGFGRELDTLLSPSLYHPSGDLQGVSAQQILDSARAGSPLPVTSLQLPDSTAPVWIVSLGNGKGENMGVQEEAFIDPQNGQILGRRATSTAPIRVIHRLHNAFLLGDGGRQWVGYLALVMAGMIVTGVIVWWPPAHGVGRSFLPRSGTKGTRLLLDLHTAAALWLFLPLLVVTITGLSMAFPQTARAVLGQAGGSGHMMMGHPVAPPLAPYPVSADQALDVARQAMPGYQTVSLSPAGLDHPHWRITLRPDHGLWIDRRQVMVDARSGDLHADAPQGFGAAYLAVQHGLHGGSSFGLPGRLLICLSGLSLSFLAISGLLVWARRHGFRAASATIPQSSELTVETP